MKKVYLLIAVLIGLYAALVWYQPLHWPLGVSIKASGLYDGSTFKFYVDHQGAFTEERFVETKYSYFRDAYKAYLTSADFLKLRIKLPRQKTFDIYDLCFWGDWLQKSLCLRAPALKDHTESLHDLKPFEVVAGRIKITESGQDPYFDLNTDEFKDQIDRRYRASVADYGLIVTSLMMFLVVGAAVIRNIKSWLAPCNKNTPN